MGQTRLDFARDGAQLYRQAVTGIVGELRGLFASQPQHESSGAHLVHRAQGGERGLEVGAPVEQFRAGEFQRETGAGELARLQFVEQRPRPQHVRFRKP